jgi:hypothetical protein
MRGQGNGNANPWNEDSLVFKPSNYWYENKKRNIKNEVDFIISPHRCTSYGLSWGTAEVEEHGILLGHDNHENS